MDRNTLKNEIARICNEYHHLQADIKFLLGGFL